MNLTETFCKFATELSYERLHRKVVERTKIVLLDAIGVMLAGSATNPGREIVQFIREIDSKNQSSIVGAKHMVSHPNSAFINASLVEILELQDGHKDSGLHPSSVVPATVMALPEYKTVGGEELITAVVIGYELMTRIGRAIRLSHVRTGTITTGTCGSLASAVAASKLIGLDHSKMTDALGIAGYFAPLSLNGSYDGPTIKPFNVGQAAWVGVVSSLLASKGFTGSTNTLDEFYSVMSPKIDESIAIQGLGGSFQIMNLYFKRFACCRFTHAAAEATFDLIADHPIAAESIDRIEVRTFASAATLNHYTNRNSNYIECQFSIPYIVAVAILDQKLDPKQFSSNRIADPRIHQLAKKVEVVLDEDIDKQFPGKYAATVSIRMENGKTHTTHIDYPKGDPENPMTDDELVVKFKRLSSPVLGDKKTNQVVKRALSLEEESDVARLIRLLH